MAIHNINDPLVSVVMAVKNGENRIAKSIESLLSQTFSDFELIIINDGSTDKTSEIIKSFSDARIHLYSQANRGVAISANRGLALARGKLIARQDHDDISKPTRLEKQVHFMEENPEIFLLGTAAEITNQNGFSGRYHKHPIESKIIKLELLFDNPFVHSSIIFRREVIRNIGLYNPDKAITPLDDYDFISRVALTYPVANLIDPLVEYYENDNSLTSEFRNSQSRDNQNLRIKKSQIMTRNIKAILNEKIDSNKLLFFTQLYSQVRLLHKDRGSIKLSEMQFILNKIFENTITFDNIDSNTIYNLKKDHLLYCWYQNPGVARSYEVCLYRSGILWERFRYISTEFVIKTLYDASVFFKKTGSKVKRKFLKKENNK